MKVNINAEELARSAGNGWGNNNEDFVNCFHEDATIEHSFFIEPVSPTVAVEVMNSTVKVNTDYVGYTLLEGDGTGKKDVVRMEFIDAGSNMEFIPNHNEKMVIDGWIYNHLFSKFKAYGYEIVVNKDSPHQYKQINIQTEYYLMLSQEQASSWADNDMDRFVSLFSEDAKIYG